MRSGPFAFPHQGTEVKAHGIGFDDGQLLFEGGVFAQTCGKIPVQLDHGHLVHLGGDRLGERGQTRAISPPDSDPVAG